MDYLNLAEIRLCTEAEGPGRRFAIWTQGCEKRCPGCCNPEMQPFTPRHIVSVEDLFNLVKLACVEHGIEGISFIGGEPVLQAVGLAALARLCRASGLSVLMFSGYYHHDLLALKNRHVEELLDNTDLLVDGPFVQSQEDTERTWIGSRNQNVLFLSNRYAPGVEFEGGMRKMELLISAKEVIVNGWPFKTV